MIEDQWHDCTHVASQYEDQISDSGQRRHRPLRLDRLGSRGRDHIGEERGIGEWRRGPAPDGIGGKTP